MHIFAIRFDTRAKLDEAIRDLKERIDLTGELSVRREEDGSWRLMVLSEKRLRESTLERLPGEIVKEK